MPALAVPAALASRLRLSRPRLLFRWRERLPLAAPNARTLHATPIPRVGGLAIWAGFLPVALFVPATPSMACCVVGRAVAPAVRRVVARRHAAAWRSPRALRCTRSRRCGSRSRSRPRRRGSCSSLARSRARGRSTSTTSWTAATDSRRRWRSLALRSYAAVLGFGRRALRLPLALAATMVPVLVVNRPPARMFLGDVGAVPLGFMAAALGLGGIADGAWPAWFPAARVPAVRGGRDGDARASRRSARERFWQSHRSHYYQRLHQLGAGHRGTLAVWAALMAGCAGSAVALRVSDAPVGRGRARRVVRVHAGAVRGD